MPLDEELLDDALDVEDVATALVDVAEVALAVVTTAAELDAFVLSVNGRKQSRFFGGITITGRHALRVVLVVVNAGVATNTGGVLAPILATTLGVGILLRKGGRGRSSPDEHDLREHLAWWRKGRVYRRLM